MRLIIFLIATFSATLISKDLFTKNIFIIWNIGQGQWTTLISEKYCDHFDIGGEVDVSKQVLKICDARRHRLHLSHWDIDHIGLLKKLKLRTQQICLWNTPLGNPSEKKLALISDLKKCNELKQAQSSYLVIYKGSEKMRASANETSEVVTTQQILIPGDSPIKEEKKWSKALNLLNVKGLILGHHGSRTSTSSELLQHLPNLRWAIVSARKKRYGHPHIETLLRLQKNKTPVLLTEDWGSIGFEI